jgi:hypothetical protein
LVPTAFAMLAFRAGLKKRIAGRRFRDRDRWT